MLNVMPELDPKRHHPPGMRNPRKSLAEHPQANEHDQGIAIVQGFGLNQPRIQQTDQAQSFRTRPPHDIDLVSLDEMLSPMRQHDEHENLQPTLMPTGIELLVEPGIPARCAMNVGNRRI